MAGVISRSRSKASVSMHASLAPALLPHNAAATTLTRAYSSQQRHFHDCGGAIAAVAHRLQTRSVSLSSRLSTRYADEQSQKNEALRQSPEPPQHAGRPLRAQKHGRPRRRGRVRRRRVWQRAHEGRAAALRPEITTGRALLRPEAAAEHGRLPRRAAQLVLGPLPRAEAQSH